MEPTKILYVEDELPLAGIVSESLEARNFHVTTLHSGEGVKERFIQLQPHLCLFDLMLPVKDGYTLADEVRTVNHRVPIIFLTAKIQTEDVLKGFRHGANDYIRKPFSIEELIVRIHNLLALAGNSPTKTAADLKLGQSRLSIYKQMLYINDKAIRLSFRETQLLCMLASLPGSIIDRKDILLALWGDDSFFNSRSLDVYIRKLRQYLEADPAVEIITIKGVGFRFLNG